MRARQRIFVEFHNAEQNNKYKNQGIPFKVIQYLTSFVTKTKSWREKKHRKKLKKSVNSTKKVIDNYQYLFFNRSNCSEFGEV